MFVSVWPGGCHPCTTLGPVEQQWVFQEPVPYLLYSTDYTVLIITSMSVHIYLQVGELSGLYLGYGSFFCQYESM
jgi:hypothetical protein